MTIEELFWCIVNQARLYHEGELNEDDFQQSVWELLIIYFSMEF